jgi:hypothetical protein
LPLSLAIFNNGTYQILDKTKEHLYSEIEKNKLLYENYISISIYTIIKDFFLSDLSGYVVPKLGLLSHMENQLFEIIQKANFISITINFKDQTKAPLVVRNTNNAKAQLFEFINKENYKEVFVQYSKREIVKIENTLKVTL